MENLSRERWRDVRRNNLLHAAGRIFARQGYAAASMEDIAFEAGIGKPTVYRYFAGKEDLFAAVISEALDDLEKRLDEALLLPGTFEQRLIRLIGEMVPTFRTHFAAIRTVDEPETSRRRLFRQRRGHLETRLRAVIEEAQARGEAQPFDAGLAAHFMMAMVRSGIGLERFSDATMAMAIVSLALHGLGANRGLPRALPSEYAHSGEAQAGA